jgi:rod shape determining protein RodA
LKRGNVIANLDWFTIAIFLFMVFLGWLNIFSAVYSDDHPGILDMSQRYGKQFVWICAALLIAVIVVLIDYRFYDFFAYLIYGASIFLLLAVLVVGKEINGAKSWFMIGGFQIQPSEFAKPAVALALAKYLSGYNVNIKDLKTFLISAVIIFTPSLLIILQPDTGSAIIFVAFILVVYREGFSVNILLGMLLLAVLFILVLLFNQFIVLLVIVGLALLTWWFLSGKFISVLKAFLIFAAVFAFFFGLNYFLNFGKSIYFIGLLSIVISSTFFLVRIFIMRIKNALYVLLIVFFSLLYSFFVNYAFHNALSDYQQHRINIVLGIESDPMGAEYNVIQSKIAIGSGGFSGKGFLQGTQTKLHFVPEQSTDFIFCTVGEEWGFIGSLVVVGLFLSLLIRLIQLAERQRNNFARIYGYGLVSIIFMHFFINISMTIGLFPVVGIPLPFFSYGGSSLWSFTILLFIFLRMDASRMDFIN